MRRFSGLEVRPVCTVTEFQPCKIDRVLVTGHKTLFGATVFVVMGWVVGADVLVPLCRDTTSFEDAWQIRQAFAQRIEEARRVEAARDREICMQYRGGQDYEEENQAGGPGDPSGACREDPDPCGCAAG